MTSHPALALMPPYVCSIAQTLWQSGMPCYAVGGCVRGAIMGLPAADYDLCGPATTQEMQKILASQTDIVVDKIFPKVGTMQLRTKDGYGEYTTFRSETYTTGHTPSSVVFTKSLSQDAFRRDFTCNAIYLDLVKGELYDPTGGLCDLANGILRATTKDPGMILRDDGLRVLRMIRFAAQLRLQIDPATYACANADLLLEISVERMMAEFSLILLSDIRYGQSGGEAALRTALSQMQELGLFAILCPNLSLDIESCVAVPPKIALRLAALLLPQTGRQAANALARLRCSKALQKQVGCLVEDLSCDTIDAYRLVRNGYGYAQELVLLRPSWEPLLRACREKGVPDSLRALHITGDQIQELLGGSSPKVGEVLQALWEYTVEHPEYNHPDDLYTLAQQRIKEEENHDT